MERYVSNHTEGKLRGELASNSQRPALQKSPQTCGRVKSGEFLQDEEPGWEPQFGDMQSGELPHAREFIVDLAFPP